MSRVLFNLGCDAKFAEGDVDSLRSAGTWLATGDSVGITKASFLAPLARNGDGGNG